MATFWQFNQIFEIEPSSFRLVSFICQLGLVSNTNLNAPKIKWQSFENKFKTANPTADFETSKRVGWIRATNENQVYLTVNSIWRPSANPDKFQKRNRFLVFWFTFDLHLHGSKSVFISVQDTGEWSTILQVPRPDVTLLIVTKMKLKPTSVCFYFSSLCHRLFETGGEEGEGEEGEGGGGGSQGKSCVAHHRRLFKWIEWIKEEMKSSVSIEFK